MGNESAKAGVYKPKAGVLTFEAEGQEGGPYHSRTLHVPSLTSGLTIGRGYDMKTKSKAQIKRDLVSVGVSEANATTLADAAGLAGESAKKFVRDNNLESFEISAEAQLKLFEVSYKSEASEVRRVCDKGDTKKVYGAVDWDKLDPMIKDVLVDLKFRGDYTGISRKIIQQHVAANDVAAFAKAVATRANWPNVPVDRFNRRKEFVKGALK